MVNRVNLQVRRNLQIWSVAEANGHGQLLQLPTAKAILWNIPNNLSQLEVSPDLIVNPVQTSYLVVVPPNFVNFVGGVSVDRNIVLIELTLLPSTGKI